MARQNYHSISEFMAHVTVLGVFTDHLVPLLFHQTNSVFLLIQFAVTRKEMILGPTSLQIFNVCIPNVQLHRGQRKVSMHVDSPCIIGTMKIIQYGVITLY